MSDRIDEQIDFDSDLPDGRLLARLLQRGVLVLDEHATLCFASPDACELLAATDEAALRDDWPAIVAQFCAAGIPRLPPDGIPFQGRIDLRRGEEVHPLRFECHAVAGDGRLRHVVLLRDRGRLMPGDRALLLASETLVNRPALSALVHEAKGPLNNFNLTLALLAAGIERLETSAIPEETFAQWRRYLTRLRAETMRLTHCLDDIHALTESPERAREPIDVGALLRDTVRVLHHDATMREVRIGLEIPPEPIRATGNPKLLQLALTSLAMCLLDVAPPGGNIRWRVEPASGTATVELRVSASPCVLPPGLVAEFFRISSAAESEHAAAIAGRTIIEAQGGEVALATGADGCAGFVLRVPAHGWRAPA